jgi:hypothetical protein
LAPNLQIAALTIRKGHGSDAVALQAGIYVLHNTLTE